MRYRFVCVSLGRRRAEEVLRFVPPTLRNPRRVGQPLLGEVQKIPPQRWASPPAAVVNRNILGGRPCTSRSTTTLAWPSLASSPIRKPTPPSPSSGMRLTSSLATASSSTLCSPITAAAIAPTSFAKPVSRWASNTAALARTRHKPTAKPNASSRPLCANGPTPLTGPTPTNATWPSLLGPTTTTTPVRMVAFTTSRPSAAPNQVQPLDHLQSPALPPRSIQDFAIPSPL